MPTDDLLACVVDGVLPAVADRPEQPILIVNGEFGADRQQCRQAGSLGEIPPVIVDAILKTRIALRVGSGLTFQDDRTAIREDEPLPDEKHPALTEADIVAVLADQPRALRDEQNAPGRAVVDMLRDLGGDLARQVGSDAGDEGRGDAAPV